MTTSKLRNRQTTEEASAWAVKLDAGALTARDKKALALWLSESALHVDELLLAAAILTGLGVVDAERKISITALLKDAAPEVVPLFRDRLEVPPPAVRETGGARRLLSRRPVAAIAAALMVALLSGIYLYLAEYGPQDQIAFVTKTGEQRSLTLADGSIVHVNTETDIQIKYSKTERSVKLSRGEAMFEVAHDTARPFRVYALGAVARAVGTKFNVRQINGVVRVAVIGGVVAVHAENPRESGAPDPGRKRTAAKPALVKAGEQASVAGSGDIVAEAIPNMQVVTSWRLRKLVFKSDSLATIAAEFNRYNYEQIYIDDESVATLRFSGVFDADDPYSFIKYLEVSNNLHIDRSIAGEYHLTAPTAVNSPNATTAMQNMK